MNLALQVQVRDQRSQIMTYVPAWQKIHFLHLAWTKSLVVDAHTDATLTKDLGSPYSGRRRTDQGGMTKEYTPPEVPDLAAHD